MPVHPATPRFQHVRLATPQRRCEHPSPTTQTALFTAAGHTGL